MIFWNVFLLLSLFCLFLFSSWDISYLSDEFHQLCLKQLNFKAKFTDIYKSLVCGKRLPAGNVREIFTRGGLIHLTVVSGAHLLFLERFWKKIPMPLLLKTYGLFLILILYALASHLHPPVVRALFSFFLLQLSFSLKLFWNASFITLLSGLLCLVYKPIWVYSFSLQLSLLACFLYNISTSPIRKSFFIYLFILPVINRWQALHPLTVLINWIFAPLISGLLFPLSFLSPFVPALYPITDFLWTAVLWLLKFIKFLPDRSFLMNWFIPKEWMWLYISLIYLIVFVVFFFKRKKMFYTRKM